MSSRRQPATIHPRAASTDVRFASRPWAITSEPGSTGPVSQCRISAVKRARLASRITRRGASKAPAGASAKPALTPAPEPSCGPAAAPLARTRLAGLEPPSRRRLRTAIPSPASNRHEPPSPPTSSDGNTTTSNLTYTVEGDEAISVATPVKLPAFRRNLTLAGGHCAPIHGMDDLSRKPRDSRPKCALMQVQDRLRHVARFRAPRDGTSRRSRRATSPVIAATIRPVTAATIIRPVAAATLGPVIPEPPARVSRHRRAR